MVRFKVIKGSQLLLGAAIVIFALVVSALVVKYALSDPAQPVSAQANFVGESEDANEAKAVLAFASVSGEDKPSGALSLDPEKPSDAENEHTDEAAAALDIEIISEPRTAVEVDAVPRILIYHTHTHEAYEQEPDDPYVALENWRTADAAHSVVRVGEELANQLEKRGFYVVHDVTDHEQSELSSAYTRSLKTLEGYRGGFDLYIDLHRDAYVENTGPVTLSANGKKLARLMVLIGRGDSFEEKPHFSENYAFASALTDRLNAIQEGICKDVLVKKNRYNQHIGTPAILIEVGNNRNTLTEALASIPCLADALEYMMISHADEAASVQLAAEAN